MSPGPIEDDGRPRTMPGYTYRVDCGHGKVFVIIDRNPADEYRMREVFIKISATIPKDQLNADESNYDSVVTSTMCSRAEAEVLGKMITTALGAGATDVELANLLRGVDCGHPLLSRPGRMFPGETITSLADAVGRVMQYDIQRHNETPIPAQAQTQN